MWHLVTTAALIVAFSTFLWSKSTNQLDQLKSQTNFDYFSHFNDISSILSDECVFPFIAATEKVALVNEVEKCPLMNDLYSIMDNKGMLTFTKRLLERRARYKTTLFSCHYTTVIELQDNENFTVGFGEETRLEPLIPTFVPFANVLAYCKDPNGNLINIKSYPNFGGQIAALKEIPYARADPEHPSLSILMFHNASLNQMIRNMPKSFDFLAQNGFISFPMFNTATENITRNALEMLYGDGAWIWERMKERNCATMLHDDIRTESPFDRNSTKEPSVDFHSRLYHQFNQQHLVNNLTGNHCFLDGRLAVDDYIDIWSSASESLTDSCHFSLGFLSDVTAYDEKFLQVADVRLLESLESMKGKGVFDKTAVVLVSDGVSYDRSKKLTLRQKIESRQGAFVIRMPDSFQPSEMLDNLRENSNRLVSNVDVYATLVDIATSREHQRSLFRRRLQPRRTCEDATIDQNQCSCLSQMDANGDFWDLHGWRILDQAKAYFSTFLCVDKVEIEQEKLTAYSTSISNFFAHDESYDYIDVRVKVKTKKFTLSGAQHTISKKFLGRFRRCLVDNAIDMVGDFLPVGGDGVADPEGPTCSFNTTSSFCERCYYSFIH